MIREAVRKRIHKLERNRDYEIKVFIIGRGKNGVLKPRTPHLASHPALDNVSHHAIHLR